MSWASNDRQSPIHGLYAIADAKWNPCTTLPEYVKRLLGGGCRLIQLRMKEVDPVVVRETALAIVRFKRAVDFTFIVNDHPDVALEVGADGVHVGNDDSSVVELKRQWGDRLMIGYSAHALDEAMMAAEVGADYVAFGAIFPTLTKGAGHPVQGLDKLREVVQGLHVPVVAIGGINRTNIGDVMKTGVSAVAMISALAQASDVETEVQWFVERMQR